MRTLIQFFYLLLFILANNLTMNAQKLITKTGTIKFEATVPSYEEVAAQNKSVSAVLDQSSGDFAVLALIKGFRFKTALMEEHFNENYMESEQFSKATFKGNIEGFDLSKVTSEGKSFTIKGNLTIHGKMKPINAVIKLSKSANGVVCVGSFDVKPQDFAIEIPSIVSKKIADKVKISYNFNLTK